MTQPAHPTFVSPFGSTLRGYGKIAFTDRDSMRMDLGVLNAMCALPADMLAENDPSSAAMVRLLVEIRLDEETPAFEWVLGRAMWMDYELLDQWLVLREQERSKTHTTPTVGEIGYLLFDWLIEHKWFETFPEVLLVRARQHAAAAAMLRASGHRNLNEGQQAISGEAEAFLKEAAG